MDYKRFYKVFIFFFIVCFSGLFIAGCADKSKADINNTFYIELGNFSKDSLKENIAENIFGKVSFYKNNKLEIISVNFVTKDLPPMHFYKNVAELKKDIEPGTRKIKIEAAGEYTVDSVYYSLQKFVYKDGNWVKFSDLGSIKAQNTYYRARQDAIKEFGKQIINSAALYSYD